MYEANGGTGAPQSQTKTLGEALILSSTVPTRDGYTFLGWSTSQTATSPEYTAEDSFTVDADTTLYAVWERMSISGYCGNDTTAEYDEDSKAYKNLIWTIDSNGKLTISGNGKMRNYPLTLQSPWRDQEIKTLEIENGVTSIGNNAFYNCSGFSGNLIIPDSVTSIGGAAFVGCSGFTGDLIIPDSVINIGDYAFYGCRFTGNLTISKSVTNIGNNVFDNCIGFTGDLIIPVNVTSIGENAFRECKNIGSIYFKGPAPELKTNCFAKVTATVYYLANDPTWTDAVKQNYGGTLTWVPYSNSEAIDVSITTPEGTNATLTAPEGGWAEGTNTFGVSCDKACVVLISNDGGKTYTKLAATANGDGSYSFTANDVTADSIITVAVKGDLNGDGQLTVADRMLLARSLVGTGNTAHYDASAIGSICADTNGDGQLTVADRLLLARALTGGSSTAHTVLSW